MSLVFFFKLCFLMQETAVQPPSPQTKAKITFHLKILMTLFQTLDIRRKDDDRAEAQQVRSMP